MLIRGWPLWTGFLEITPSIAVVSKDVFGNIKTPFSIVEIGVPMLPFGNRIVIGINTYLHASELALQSRNKIDTPLQFFYKLGLGYLISLERR